MLFSKERNWYQVSVENKKNISRERMDEIIREVLILFSWTHEETDNNREKIIPRIQEILAKHWADNLIWCTVEYFYYQCLALAFHQKIQKNIA